LDTVTTRFLRGSRPDGRRYSSVRDEAWRFLLGLSPDVVLVQEAMLDVPAWVRDEGALFVRPALEGQNWGSGVLVRGAAATEVRLESLGSYLVAGNVERDGVSMFVASMRISVSVNTRFAPA
jgi:hypothetical protein